MRRLVLGLVALALASLLAIAVLVFVVAKPPGDDELIEYYRKNAAALGDCAIEMDRLAVERVLPESDCGPNPKLGFSTVCAALTSLGVRAATRTPDGNLLFSTWLFGAPGSSRKGIARGKAVPPELLRTSLDDRSGLTRPLRLWYRAIEGEWFVFYEEG